MLRYLGVDCQHCNCAISPDNVSKFHQSLFDAGIQSALYRLLFCFVGQKPAGCMRQHCRWSPAPRSIPSIRISGVFIWCVTMSMTLEKFWDTHTVMWLMESHRANKNNHCWLSLRINPIKPTVSYLIRNFLRPPIYQHDQVCYMPSVI